jgi:TolB-like protein/Flp pilus assembly protein TadD/tRNA A-37 threonylcarbamoyl transferase component Bud32
LAHADRNAGAARPPSELLAPPVTDLSRLQKALAGRYTLDREIGQGGMATVYLAEDVRHHRRVALKVLRPELAATLGVDRFLREIEVAANLQHPHILPLFDSGEAGGFLFYVMPYIEGESLRAKLARGELPVAESAKVLRDIVDALSYAHQHGVVHRDIKPDNVLLSGRHALVTDFGVAKAVSEATGRQALTTAGVALGTPMYMAPEQAVADPHVDARADLYAVGVIAYEMLTGKPPFAGPTAQAVLAAHVTEPARPITAVRQSVPAPLAQLVMQCLEKRPADRPVSAEALLPVLETLATPSGGITPTATAPVRALSGQTVSRRVPRWAIATAGAVVLAGVAYAAVRTLRSTASAAAQSVAVLPFENVGGDSANRTLTDGIQDEILTALTRIGALQVTSRTSVQEYRGSSKGVKQIGTELGVRTLLEGQVQRAGNQVHVNVQLVDAGRDRQMWAESYDRELTAQNVFALQGDIAQNVARALQANLSPTQEAAVAKAPTTDLVALDWYHRGKDLYAARSGAFNDTATTQAFERAVALDSGFAAAWAGLAAARSWQIRNGRTTDTVPARSALDRAVALDPGSPETAIAQAYYAYYARGDYGTALVHFQAVAAIRPGDVDAISGIGYIARRQGRWDDALAAEQRVTVLSPRDPQAVGDLGLSYMDLRQYDRAEELMRRSLILDPGSEGIRAFLLQSIIAGRGDTAAGRVELAALPPGSTPDLVETYRALLARLAGDYATSTAAEAAIPLQRPLDGPIFLLFRALNDLASGARASARRRADSVAVAVQTYLGQHRDADVFGNLADFHTVLGLAEAIRGNAREAVAAGERAVALNPMSRDALEAPRSLDGLIEIHVLLDHVDDAVRMLREQAHRPLSTAWPLPISRAMVRLDPLFQSIRRDPRVQALLNDDQAWVVH